MFHDCIKCMDCGRRAPSVNTEDSLISTRGWRLILKPEVDGLRGVEWRCPKCWERFRGRA